MKKKLLCLLMAALMLCMPLVLTSCDDDKEAEVVDNSEREEIYLTLYTITDEKTTEEGILRIQKAMDEILYNRYKTHIVLKCFTEDEYAGELEKLYAEFAALEEKEREEAAAQKEEEKKREEAERDLSRAERHKLQQQRAKEAAELKAKEEEEAEARLERIKLGLEDPISGPQIDLFYLPSDEAFYDAIADERLLPLDDFLKVDFKEMYSYLSKNLLTNATVAYDEEDAALYAIPNNGPVAGEGWYYVFNTELAAKYGYNLNVTTPQFADFAAYVHEIAKNEPGVIPIANPAPANNIDFYNDVEGFPIAAANSEYGVFEARNVTQTYNPNSPVRTHFAYMAEFREAGYFADREMTTSDNFFLDMRQGSMEDVKEWESQGYTVLTYRRPATQVALCRSGFYGISSFCGEDYQERAMEVLQALYTNVELHNLFAFGQVDVDYAVNEDGITVTKLTDDYTMDFKTTGNTLLGYLPAGYDADYIQKAHVINRASRLSGFASFFLLMDEDEKLWFDEILGYEAECVAAYEQMCRGVSNWEEICNDLYQKLDKVDMGGFVSEVLAPKYRAAAKQVRSADGDNYTSGTIYFQSEYDALLNGGLLEEEGDASETPAA